MYFVASDKAASRPNKPRVKDTGRYVALFLGTRNTCRESQVTRDHEPRLLDSRQSAVHPAQSTFACLDDKLTPAKP